MTSALLFCRLQRFEDVRRLSHRVDVPLNQKVDESRDHGGYFRVLLRVVREQPFVRRVVAQLSHRIPDRLLVGWQFQIFNSVVKVLPFAAEVIDQPFKGYAQQCACSDAPAIDCASKKGFCTSSGMRSAGLIPELTGQTKELRSQRTTPPQASHCVMPNLLRSYHFTKSEAPTSASSFNGTIRLRIRLGW